MTVVSEIERTELVNQLVATIGEGPAETLMNCVLPDGRDQLATKEDLTKFATKDDLAKFATKEDLTKFATKEDLTKFATKEDLKALEAKMATKEDLTKFATKEDLKALEAKMATKEDLTKFATKEDLEVFGAKLAAELRSEMAKQARFFFMALTGLMATTWGMLAAQFFV